MGLFDVATRMGLEAHRYNQPYCMGTLYWQFNDCWPVASWSSRDYFGNWKALNYAVQQVFQPLALSVVSKPNGLSCPGEKSGEEDVPVFSK